ncbi:hypothetical protein EPUL_005985, partial [Erysiphe pulchra]
TVTSVGDAIKALLDPTNPYKRRIEEEYPGVDGASGVMPEQRVYKGLQNVTSTNLKVSKPSWAEIAGVLENRQKFLLKSQIIRVATSNGQNKEYRRVIIKLTPDNETLVTTM